MGRVVKGNVTNRRKGRRGQRQLKGDHFTDVYFIVRYCYVPIGFGISFACDLHTLFIYPYFVTPVFFLN